MALLFTCPHSTLFSSPNPITKQPSSSPSSSSSSLSLSFPISRPRPLKRLLQNRPLRVHSDEEPEPPSGLTDEWGEPAEPELASAQSKLSDADPTTNDDEWGPQDGFAGAAVEEVTPSGGNGDEKRRELKRCVVDSVYGTQMGFGAKTEERAEIMELVNQLEALNPTPAPTQCPELLDGNWALLYTGSSELLPLLAMGSTPLLKVDKITQSIDTSSSTIVNSITLSNALSTFTFSASATFEVRTPSRIQVQFKEGKFEPPEIKSSVELPEEVEVFGQKINLNPLQQGLGPIQGVVANISRVISGQPSLKLPIPGERTASWLLTTYLDTDFRISRGDGGLFVLAKEGCPLLYQ